MPSEGSLASVIEALYRAPLEPEQWTVALEGMVRLVGCEVGIFFHQDLTNFRTAAEAAVGFAPDWQELYYERFAELDPHTSCDRAQRLVSGALGITCTTESVSW